MLLALSLLALSTLAAGTKCPPLDSVAFLIAHEHDCTKFYICAHGTPVLQSCPAGTHFNPTFMVCQAPVFAGCSTQLPEPDLACSWPDFVVPRPHPDTCSKYYVCEYGVPHVFDCPDGLEFSEEFKRCVWPHESNCNTTNGGNDQTDAPQNGGCEEGELSSNEDCSKYNICDHGVPVAMDCPAGLKWNSKLQQCVWPHEADCPSDVRCTDGELSPSGHCDKYNVCSNGVTIAMDCPAGLYWNSVLERCVWPHESDCRGLNLQNGGAQDGACEEGALSSNEDCSKYNICNHGVPVAMDCPAGLKWNSKLEQCVWPHEADCPSDVRCTDGELSPSGHCDKYNVCSNGVAIAMDCPAGLYWNSVLERCVWPHESDCRGLNLQNGGAQDGACEEGALSSNADCSKYNICNHGVPVAMDCPAGLLWNSNTKHCDWPWQAGCA